MTKNSFELPDHELNFITGKFLQENGDRMVLKTYIWSKTITVQCYTNAGKSVLGQYWELDAHISTVESSQQLIPIEVEIKKIVVHSKQTVVQSNSYNLS